MKLSTYLEVNNISMAEFGRMLDRDPALISRYCNLSRIPRLPVMIKIKELTNGEVGTFEDWARDGGEECQQM